MRTSFLESLKTLSRRAGSSSVEDWRGEREEQREELGNITKVRVRAKVHLSRESGCCGALGWMSDVCGGAS